MRQMRYAFFSYKLSMKDQKMHFVPTCFVSLTKCFTFSWNFAFFLTVSLLLGIINNNKKEGNDTEKA